jgi:hypothetical protein
MLYQIPVFVLGAVVAYPKVNAFGGGTAVDFAVPVFVEIIQFGHNTPPAVDIMILTLRVFLLFPKFG